MSKRLVLVTGGAGFIGSHVVDRFLEEGYSVRVLDDLSTGSLENLESRDIDVRIGSVTDEETVGQAIKGVDVVVHMAAARAVGMSIEDPVTSDRVNTGGTLLCLDVARRTGVSKFVFASSSSVYGGTAPLPASEEAPCNPRSPYAVSKLAGEQYSKVFNELFGMRTVVLRLFNVFGPRQRPESPYAAAVPLFIDALMQGQRPVVYGDGSQTRDFTYVEDVAEAVVLATTTELEGFTLLNIAAGGRHSVLELLETIASILGRRAEPDFKPPRPGDVAHSQADTSRALQLLGWKARTTFEEGLEKTIRWAMQRSESPG